MKSDLLTRINNYPQFARDLRKNAQAELTNLINNNELAIKKIDEELSVLKAEADKKQERCEELKENLKASINQTCKEKIYASIGAPLSYFKAEDDLGLNKEFESLDKAKAKLLFATKQIKYANELLVAKKNEKENKIIDFDSKKKKLDSNLNYAINKVRIPLQNDYKTNYLRCPKNFMPDDKLKDNDTLPLYVAVGSYLPPYQPELADICKGDVFKVPLDIDVKNSGNIILRVDVNQLYDNQRIDNIISGIILKYIEAFPSGHLNIGLYSSSIASLDKLSALFAGSVKGGINITKETCRSISQFSFMLLEIVKRGEAINSKLLENNCYDLYELYNKNIRTEKFQLIILHDIFKDLSVENINQLHGCMSGLAKCGIRFIVIDDFNPDLYIGKTNNFKIKLNQILNLANVFDLTQKSFHDSDNNLIEFPLTTRLIPQDVYNFINEYCGYANKHKTSYLTYENIGFGKVASNENTYESLSIPVALSAPDYWEIKFDCLGQAPNANLIVGMPGTGKSTLIDALIMNGAMKYSPDELTFQLLDFKDAISSSVYTMKNCQIPHIKVVSQQNRPEDAEIILANILFENAKRINEFKALGEDLKQPIKNIVEYNTLIAKENRKRNKMPRLIIVVDECQYLFEDDNLAAKCQKIIRIGRSQGIHLILATQGLSHRMWNTIKFIEGIYCFFLADDDARQLLPKYASRIPAEIPTGSYLAFASNNKGEICKKIRIAYDGGKTTKYAKAIRERWNEYHPNIVVVGDKSAKYISLAKYNELLGQCEQDTFPIGINYIDNSLLALPYKKQKPMFLIGTSDKPADSVMRLLIQTAVKNKITTYLIDASEMQKVKNFAAGFHSQQLNIGNENDYLKSLHDVYMTCIERDKNPRGVNPPVFFIINALQMINDFLNNKKYSSAEAMPALDSNLSMREIIARATANNEKQNSDLVSGKETLISYLMNNAYKANIFICLSVTSLALTSNTGEQVLTYAHRNIIRTCAYKLLYPNCSDDVKNIMEDAFKDKMLSGLSNNMAFLSLEQRDFIKLKFFQFTKEEGDINAN